MRTIDLIAQLQKLVDDHKASGAEEVMGEHEIVIDVFRKYCDTKANVGWYQYGGFDPDIRIEKSDDGVYDILSAFSTKEISEGKLK